LRNSFNVTEVAGLALKDRKLLNNHLKLYKIKKAHHNAFTVLKKTHRIVITKERQKSVKAA